MFGPGQPVTEYFKESLLPHFGRSVKIAGERADGFLVDLEKEPVFAAEVLEDRPLGDAKRGRDISHPGGVVPLLGKMPHGRVYNPGPLSFRPGPRRHAAVTRR